MGWGEVGEVGWGGGGRMNVTKGGGLLVLDMTADAAVSNSSTKSRKMIIYAHCVIL